MSSSTSVLIRPQVSVNVGATAVVGDAPTVATPTRIVTIQPGVVSGVVSVPTPVLPNDVEVLPETLMTLISMPAGTPKTGSKVSAVVVLPNGADIRLPTLVVPPVSTLLENNAEGSASGNPLAGGQTGSGDPFDSIVGTVLYDSAQKMHGTKSYHISAIAGAQSEIIWSSANDPYAACRAYIRFNTLPGVAQDLMELRNSAGNAAKFSMSSVNKFWIQNSVGSVLGTFTTPFTTGVWYRIELTCTPGAGTTDGAISGAYYLGDATTPVDSIITSGAGTNAGTTAITGARYGKITTATATLDCWMDDVAFAPSLATFIGPPTNATVTATPPRVTSVITIPTPTITSLGTKPNATNTGVPTGTVLTVVSGAVNINTAGTSFTSVHFTGLVKVSAADVTFTNCLFSGGPGTSAGALVDCRPAANTNTKFFRCTFRPDTPSVWLDAVIGHHYEATQCDCSGVTDAFGVYNNFGSVAGVSLFSNYCHDAAYFAPDALNHSSAAPNGTHNDMGVQWQGGTGLTVVGNNFQGFYDPTIGEASYTAASPNPSGGGPNNTGGGVGWNPTYPNMWTNSCMQVTNASGQTVCSGLLWDKNWHDGGGFQINVGNKTGSYPNLGTISNSKCGHNSAFISNGPFIIPKSSGATVTCNVTLTNNVYEDTGAAVPVLRN